MPRPLMALTVGWITGAVLAFIMPVLAAVALPEAFPLGLAVYILYSLQTCFMLRRIGSFRSYTWLLYPVPLLFFFALMTRAFADRMLGRAVSWKGRTIPAMKDMDQNNAV